MSEINISYFKSIIDQDRAAVVICNLNHEIIYMNPAAVVNYGKRGGDKLIGRSLLECHNKESQEKVPAWKNIVKTRIKKFSLS